MSVAQIPNSASVLCLLLDPPDETYSINSALVSKSKINSTNRYPNTGVIAPITKPVRKLSLSMGRIFNFPDNSILLSIHNVSDHVGKELHSHNLD